jgi:hypothetical protein
MDAASGSGDKPGRLVFSTTADGASSPTERLRIDSTGQIEANSLGTAAAPVWSFLSDPNTGLYSPGADQVAISTNGTGRLFIDASGNVGAGVSSPATASFGNTIRNKAPAGTGAAGYFAEGANSDTWFGIYSGTGTSDSAALVYPSTGSLRIATTTGVGVGGFSERLRLDSSGRLGLGTSSPSDKLSVYTSSASDTVIGIGNTAGNGWAGYLTGGGDLLYGLQTAGNVAIRTNNTNRIYVTSAGNVGIGTTSPGAILHATSADDAKTAIIAGATNRIRAYGHLASFGGSV